MCKSQKKRREEAKALSHEERVKQITTMKYAGFGMMALGVASTGGLIGGLWNIMQATSLAAASGPFFGLVFGGMGVISASQQMRDWDVEFSQEAQWRRWREVMSK